jgi:hypothetical protein
MMMILLLQLTFGRPYSSLALRDYDPSMSTDYLGMDQSRSYFGGRSLSGGATSALDGHLRDTAISGLSDPYDHDRSRFLASRRFVGDCRAPKLLSSAREFK